MAGIQWLDDVEEGLRRSRTERKPMLLDFSAAPT